MQKLARILNSLILIFLILIGTAFADETIPTGIPDPASYWTTFDPVDDTVESVYGDTNYYTHWVDNTDGGCSDAGDGTPTTPRCTLPTLSSLSAGDVVQIRGGPYTGSSLTIGGSGTGSQPIFVRGESSTNKVNIQRVTTINDTYIIVENIKFSDTGSNHVISLSGDYTAVRYCEIVGTGSYSSNNTLFSPSGDYQVITHTTAYNGGDWQYGSENDIHAFGSGSGNSYTWYLWCTAYHCGGDGWGNSHNANHVPHHLFIGGCTSYENMENAVDLKEIHDIVISENTFHDFVSGPASSGEAVVLHYGPTSGDGPYNAWVINNTIYNSVYGIVLSSAQHDIYIIGNLIYDCTTGINPDRAGPSVSGNPQDWYVLHNTVVDVTNGIIQGGSVPSDMAAYWLKGNIVAYASGDHFEIYDQDAADVADISYELYYQGGSDISILWRGTTYTSISAANSATGEFTNSYQQDPNFTNYSGNDFSVTSGVDGYDMSTIMSSYQTEWGVALNKDIAGTTRPGGQWDIGAYEYDGGSTLHTIQGITINGVTIR